MPYIQSQAQHIAARYNDKEMTMMTTCNRTVLYREAIDNNTFAWRIDVETVTMKDGRVFDRDWVATIEHGEATSADYAEDDIEYALERHCLVANSELAKTVHGIITLRAGDYSRWLVSNNCD